MGERFILQASKKQGFYICTDTINEIVCNFEKGKFNESQKFTFLNDDIPTNLPTIMREFADYLISNHSDKV